MTGPSLELKDPTLDNAGPVSWKASSADAGSPGRPNVAPVPDSECPAVMALGDVGSGVPAIDAAAGHAWMMWSSQDVHTRFADVHPLAADHLIVVQFAGGEWVVDNNSTLTPFAPAADDCLVAELDLSANTVSSLQGVDQVVNGIDAGYPAGDLVVTANEFGGSPNTDEFGVSGTRVGD